MRLETFELRRLFIPSAQRSERFSREPAPFNLRKFVSLSFGERRAMCDEGQERMAEGEGGRPHALGGCSRRIQLLSCAGRSAGVCVFCWHETPPRDHNLRRR